jgi:hypothetical protein
VRIQAPSFHCPDLPAEGVPEGNIWRDNAGCVSAFLFRSHGESGISFPRFAAYIFPEAQASQERIPIVIAPTPSATREQLIDQLMRNVVPLLLQSRGIQVLHASAIRLRGGVVGLCGRSFSGKSTLAYALRMRGYEVCADDSLLISATYQGVQALDGLPAKLRLRADANKYFGVVDGACLTATDTMKDEFDVYLPELHGSPLRALYLIHRSNEQLRVWSCDRLNGHQALKQVLAMANYYKLAEIFERRRVSENCLNVVGKVPIYNCRYRNGFNFIEDVVDEIDRSLSGF